MSEPVEAVMLRMLAEALDDHQRRWRERPWWRKFLGMGPKYRHRYFIWQ